MSQCPECGGTSLRRSRRRVRPGSARRPFALWLRCNTCGSRFVGTDWPRVGRWATLGATAAALLALSAGVRSPGLPSHGAGHPDAGPPPASWASGDRAGLAAGSWTAAQRGDPDAQRRLGLALLQEYREGGEHARLDEGLAWLHRAAEQGDARAQFALGDLHESGSGVIQDFAEAARWFRAAAEKGHSEAMLSLGQLAGTGRGVPQDRGEAYVWLNLAAARGEARAEPARDQVGALLPPDELAAAQERSRELHAKIPQGR